MGKLSAGFTLIELIVVIGIVTLLAGIVIMAINPARQFAQARNTQRRSDVRAIQSAIDQQSVSPRPIADQVTNPVLIGTTFGLLDLSSLVPDYIPAIPTDPKGGEAANTKYGLYKARGGRIVVCATAAELSQAIGTGDCNVVFPPPSSSLLSGLRAYWKLGEASGARADSAGSNSLTDINGVGQVIGVVGNAAHFSLNQSQALGVASNPSVTFGTSSFTIALWAKWDSFQTDAHLMAKSTGDQIDQNEWLIRSESSSIKFRAQKGAQANEDVIHGPSLNLNRWYFIVAAFDAASNTMSLQINNGTSQTVNHSGGVNETAAPLLIGARGSLADQFNYFDGTIDSVGLWGRDLNSQERSQLYNNGNGLEHPF